jgi:hypothetical protein
MEGDHEMAVAVEMEAGMLTLMTTHNPANIEEAAQSTAGHSLDTAPWPLGLPHRGRMETDGTEDVGDALFGSSSESSSASGSDLEVDEEEDGSSEGAAAPPLDAALLARLMRACQRQRLHECSQDVPSAARGTAKPPAPRWLPALVLLAGGRHTLAQRRVLRGRLSAAGAEVTLPEDSSDSSQGAGA